MAPTLSAEEIDDYHGRGFVKPVRVFNPQEASVIRRKSKRLRAIMRMAPVATHSASSSASTAR